MKTIKWCGYEWITQERWGQIHPTKPVSWYDSSAVELRWSDKFDKEQLILKTHKNPKYFPNLDIKSPIGVGLVSCTEKFKYGHFEIEAKLPTGAHLWPAFWMWAFESWPPEIDVFEGYSNKKGSYFNWKKPLDILTGKFFAVDSNFHLGEEPNNYALGAQSHYYTWKKPNKSFNKYGVDWLEDRIEIWFNDRLVRQITDKKVLDMFNKTTQNVIINNAVQNHVDSNNPPESEFIINYFRYIPH